MFIFIVSDILFSSRFKTIGCHWIFTEEAGILKLVPLLGMFRETKWDHMATPRNFTEMHENLIAEERRIHFYSQCCDKLWKRFQ